MVDMQLAGGSAMKRHPNMSSSYWQPFRPTTTREIVLRKSRSERRGGVSDRYREQARTAVGLSAGEPRQWGNFGAESLILQYLTVSILSSPGAAITR